MKLNKYSSSKNLNSINSERKIIQSNTLKNALIKNKNLVNILNHKMFKGFQKIKTLMNPNFNIDEFLEKVSDDYYPMDENYEIYYQKKYLSKLQNRKASFSSIKFNNNNITNETNISKTISKSKTQSEFFITNNENFKKKKNKIYSILDNYREKNINDEILDLKEKNITTSYPIIMIDKLHNDELNPPIQLNLSFYNLKNDYNDYYNNSISFKKKLARCQSDFLYHLSHRTNDKILSPMNFKSDKRLYRPQEIIKLRNQIKSQENNVFYDFNSNRSFYEKRNKSQNLFNKSNSKYESYYNTLIQNSVNKRKYYKNKVKEIEKNEKKKEMKRKKEKIEELRKTLINQNSNLNNNRNKKKNNSEKEDLLKIIFKNQFNNDLEKKKINKINPNSNLLHSKKKWNNYNNYIKNSINNDNRLLTMLKRLKSNEDFQKIILKKE